MEIRVLSQILPIDHPVMQRTAFLPHRNFQAGFTLVELGVVVLIISIMMTIAMQSFRKYSVRTRTSIVLNDFRVIAGAMQTYNQENAVWPPTTAAGTMPAVMQGYLKQANWTQPTPIGGYYTWATNSLQRGTRYQAVIIISTAKKDKITTDATQLTDIDKKGDDGNTATGNIFLGANNYLVYVVEK